MTDNEGLNHTNPYPNVTLDPEFDMVEERYITYQQYKIAASFKHVEGYHNSIKSPKSLSLPGQLNVEADHLASSFYCEGLLSTKNINMTPSCRAKLSIQGISVTNNHTKQILQAYTEPHYIQYLQDCFHWKKDVTI